MTRKELTAIVAKRSYFTQQQVNDMLTALELTIKDGLATDGEVKLFQGMKFDRVEVQPRTARNPRNGEKIHVDGYTKTKCRITKFFDKDIYNG